MGDDDKQPISSPLTNMPTEILEMILDPSSIIERIRHDLKGESGPYIRALKRTTGNSLKDKDGIFLLDNDGNQIPEMKEVLDENGNQIPETYWMLSGSPSMNAVGIESMISLLNKYINRNTIFSQMDEQDILKMMLILDYNMTDLFASKYSEYKIDINRMSIIKDGILDMCYFAMKQSQNKALMDALTKFFSVQEMKDTSKKGFSLSDLSPLRLLHRGDNIA